MAPIPPALAAGPRPRAPGTVPLQRLRVLFALVVREMGAKFGRSSGGYLWAIAEPLGGILLLAIAFSLALRAAADRHELPAVLRHRHRPLPLYNTMAKAVRERGQHQPRPAHLSGGHAARRDLRELRCSSFLTIIWWRCCSSPASSSSTTWRSTSTPAAWCSPSRWPPLLGLGVGTLNCVLFGFFPTWKNVWGVLTRPLFLVSGVFFTFDTVPPAFQEVLWYNPLAHVIGVMRSGFYGTYEAHYVSYPYVSASRSRSS